VQFKVGTGLTDEHREDPLPIGGVVTVRYQELTPAGVPRFPVFIAARDYE
jgi:DNA ligase-1